MPQLSPEESPSRDWRSALARWVPVGLLVGVAASQFFLAHTRDLVPWKGGGFGMFSTVDTLEQRAVRYEVLDPGTGEASDVLIRFNDPKLQAAHEQIETGLRLIHHPGRAGEMAKRVMGLPLVSGGGQAGALLEHYQTLLPPGSMHFSERRRYLTPLQAGDRQTEPFRIGAGVRVTVWRQTFESRNAEAGWEMVGNPVVAGLWEETTK